jgi:hypothetical protein
MIYKFGLFESLSKAKQFFEPLLSKQDFTKIVDADKSKNHKDLPAMMFYFHKKEASMDEIVKYFELYNLYRNAIGTLEYVKNKDTVLLKGEPITFLKLTEIIDGYNARKIRKKLGSEKYDIDSDLVPIWENDRYSIYLADTQNKCVELGRGQTFCISRGDSSNMWPNYRKSDVATFYFIFDRTPNIESEGLVVVDARGNGSKVLTDKRNSTGYKNFDQYIKENPELKAVENIFKNKPYTELEKILKNGTVDLQAFNRLSPIDKEEYLSMGKEMKDDIWNVLTSDQKNVYINSGAWLKPNYVETLSESQMKRYEKMCWRKIENRCINSIGNYSATFEEKAFLENKSFSDILAAEISQKAKTEIANHYLVSGMYTKISDQDLKNILSINVNLLRHVKGLSMKQMTMAAQFIKKINSAKAA